MDDEIDLRVHADLTFFTSGGAHRLRVPVPGPRSVKDAVESVGIPHPEVGGVVVDGRSVDLGHTLRGGERVQVHPAAPRGSGGPPPGESPGGGSPPGAPSRFVCDVHLGRLARRLRLLGFDTWYRTEADDAELADIAVAQERTLLTRDRGLMMRRVVVHAYCPRSDDPEEQTVEVIRRFGMQGRLRPLTRCVRCNGRLVAVPKEAVAADLPPRTRVEQRQFARCEHCGQVYWPGSHLPRIEGLVERFRAATRPSASGSWPRLSTGS